jgi:excinuclease ABC subunit B
VREVAKKGYRSLVTVLTKKMAESLTEFMHEQGIKVRYMHSDIDTLERIEILRDLRLGSFDVLVGINLLREGLDIPECGFVAILDADKEGFLRSETSLIQTIGRAARNVDGYVILYADTITGSMQRALAETDRRRQKQMAYNEANGISPQSVKRAIADGLDGSYESPHNDYELQGLVKEGAASQFVRSNFQTTLKSLEARMREAASNLEFEEAAKLRDELKRMRLLELDMANDFLKS